MPVLLDPDFSLEIIFHLTKTNRLTAPPHFTAYSSTKCDGTNPFLLHISDLQRDLTVNITSLYAVGAEAVEGFSKLPDHISKTSIFVGNKQSNYFVVPMLVSLGMGKCAAAYLMENAAKAFGELPYR